MNQPIQAQCSQMALEMVLEMAVVLVEMAVVLAEMAEVATAVVMIPLVHSSPTPLWRDPQNTTHLLGRCQDCNNNLRNNPGNTTSPHTLARQWFSGLTAVETALELAVEQLVPLENHHQAEVKENCQLKSLEQCNQKP